MTDLPPLKTGGQLELQLWVSGCTSISWCLLAISLAFHHSMRLLLLHIIMWNDMKLHVRVVSL